MVAKVDIPEGAIITGGMLVVRRPGTGIEPKYMGVVIGRKIKKGMKMGESVDWGMLEL